MSIQKQKKKSMWGNAAQWWGVDIVPWTYMRAIGMALFVMLSGLTALYGYRWYRIEKNSVAQQIFSECMEEYQKAYNQKNSDQWEHVRMITQLGYDQNKTSDYAPYFLIMLANIAQEQSDISRAIQLMQQALNHVSPKVSVYNLYKTKLALMKIDSIDDRMQGLQELDQIAHDQNNKQRDMALYYLGLYYWTENNIDKAIEYWKSLEPFAQGEQPSPWALQVKQYLQQVSVP